MAVTVICTECEQCGEHMDALPAEVVKGWGKFCSRECKVDAMNNKVSRKCQHCGSPFTVWPSRVAMGNGRFCSTECSSSATATSVDRECQTCGAHLSVKPARIAVGRGKFCSKSCSMTGRPINGQPSKQADDSIDLWAEAMPGVPHEREYRMGRWSIDLAFPQCKVAIELDGVYWHSMPKNIERDARKDAMLADKGWRIHRITMNKGDTPEDISERIGGACLVMGVA